MCARKQIQAVVDIAESVLPVLGQKVEDAEKLTQYLDWRNVQKMRAGDVLNLLIQADDFDTARAWAELHNISESRYQVKSILLMELFIASIRKEKMLYI